MTMQTVAQQAPLSLEFSSKFPPPDLSPPGVKPESLVSPVLADRFFTTVPPRKAQAYIYIFFSIMVYYRILSIVLCAVE